jgi:hypothetical protein
MTTDTGMHFRRRSILLGLLTVALEALAGGLVTRLVPARNRRVGADPAPLDFFGDRNAAAAIGARYLASHPEDRDGGRILREMALTTRPRTRAELHERLCEQHARDFADDRTVVVDGWVLSRTEARLCALTALLGEHRRAG